MWKNLVDLLRITQHDIGGWWSIWKWETGLPSCWEEEVDDHLSLSFALKVLAQPNKVRNFDLSGVGYGNDFVHTTLVSDLKDTEVATDKLKKKEKVDSSKRHPAANVPPENC